jgi:tetratricopeptide (TPR) repeat protein
VSSGSFDVDTRLAALDIRARALDFLGDQAELRAVFQLGKQEFFGGDGLDRLREAVGLARRAGALIELAWAEETLAIALILQGDPAAALEVLEAAIPRARELRLDQLGFLLAERAGALSFTRESVDELFAEAEAVAPAPELLLATAGVRADIAMRHGRYEEAVAYYERAIELMTGMPGVAPMDGPCYPVWALAALGRTGEAAAALHRAEAMPDLARWHPRPVIVAAGRALLAGDPAGVDAAAHRVHGVGELRGERRVGHAATLPEDLHDLVSMPGEHRVRHGQRTHPGRAGEQRGVLGRQEELPDRLVVLDDAAGRYGAEPFAYVPLAQPGPAGQLLACCRGLGGRREQAGAVSDVHHRAQQAPGENRHHAPAESLGPGAVKCGPDRRHHVLPVVGDPIIRECRPSHIRGTTGPSPAVRVRPPEPGRLPAEDLTIVRHDLTPSGQSRGTTEGDPDGCRRAEGGRGRPSPP